MIKRHIEPEFLQLLGEYPIVTILGPRQSGKTTLAKQLLPDYSSLAGDVGVSATTIKHWLSILEADLLLQQGRQLMPIEIKSSATYKPELLKTLKRILELSP